MALKMPKLFGERPKAAGDTDLDMPTTQVKMSQNTPAGYDPLASVSIMEQLRTATATMKEPRKLPVMKLNPAVTNIFDFKYEDFTLEAYDPHPAIKAPVAV